MSEKIKKILKESIKFVIILAIILNVVSYYKSLDLNKDKLDIHSFKLLDNSIYKLPEDKPVLIYFWASWCPICKVQSPNIKTVSKEYEVVTIVSQSGNKEEVEKYLEKNNLKFKVVNDEEGLFAQKFNITAFPTTFIYDKHKNLKFTEVGYTSTAGLYTRLFLSE